MLGGAEQCVNHHGESCNAQPTAPGSTPVSSAHPHQRDVHLPVVIDRGGTGHFQLSANHPDHSFQQRKKLFNRIEQDVRLDLHRTYQPIRHLLSLLADNPATEAPDLEQRLALLKPFSQSLKDNPDLASLYLGYGNGDFFMVRPLRTGALKTLVKAPEMAAYQVWSIEHPGSGQIRSQSMFFSIRTWPSSAVRTIPMKPTIPVPAPGSPALVASVIRSPPNPTFFSPPTTSAPHWPGAVASMR